MVKKLGSAKKVLALTLSATMALSMLPIQGTKVSADTQNSAYEIVMEPQLEYDYVYGYEGNYIKVANKGKNADNREVGLWGLTDKNGNEIVSCNYTELNVLDDKNILVSDIDNNWKMLDEKGQVKKEFVGYSSIWQEESGKLHANWEKNGENGYDIIDYDGNILKKDDSDDIEYTGTTQYDEVEYMGDGKHFFVYNKIKSNQSNDENTDESDDDNYTIEGYEGWLVEADGTVVKELGKFNYYNVWTNVIQIENNDNSAWGDTYVNMEGKTYTVDESKHNITSMWTSDKEAMFYTDQGYVKVEFPSLEETEVKFSFEIATSFEWDKNTICLQKKDDEKWYLYNYGGSLVKELKLPENAEPENKVGDDRIWAVAYENDERITYLLDSDGNIIKSYDFMNSGDINHYIYNYDEASLIKIIYGRKNDENYESDDQMLIDARTGEIICDDGTEIHIDEENDEDGKLLYTFVYTDKTSFLYRDGKKITFGNNNDASDDVSDDSSRLYLSEYDTDNELIIIKKLIDNDGVTDWRYNIYDLDGKLLAGDVQDYNRLSGILVVEQNDNWSILDNKGNTIKSNIGKYTNVWQLSDSTFCAENLNSNEKAVKIFSQTGDVLASGVEEVYVYNGLAIMDDNSLWTIYNENGKKIKELGKYKVVASVGEDVIIAADSETGEDSFLRYKYENPAIFDRDGKLLVEQGKIEDIGIYFDNVIPVKVNGKWGFYKLNIKSNTGDEETTTSDKDNSETTGNNQTTGSQETTKNNQTTATSQETSKNNQTTTKNNQTITTKKKVTTKANVPDNTKIAKTVKGKKKVSLQFKKVKGAKGYLVQYSLKRNFKSDKSKYVKSNKVTIKKLKAKKTYYFRVKAYKLQGKQKVFSSKWSGAKKVKIKK